MSIQERERDSAELHHTRCRAAADGKQRRENVQYSPGFESLAKVSILEMQLKYQKNRDNPMEQLLFPRPTDWKLFRVLNEYPPAPHVKNTPRPTDLTNHARELHPRKPQILNP